MKSRDGAAASAEARTSPRRESRRMKLLKRAGLFTNDTMGAEITRACSVGDLQSAFRLVHDTFVEAGYVLRHPSGIRVRAYEAVVETATFVAKSDQQVVGVQSIVLDSPDLGVPSDQSFRKEIDVLREGGKKIAEATNEAICPSYRKSAVPTELMRSCFAHAVANGCNELLTTVSPGHAKFYELLGFRVVSEVRSYSSKIDDPVLVVSLDIDGLEERFRGVTVEDGDDEGFIYSYYIADNPYNRYVDTWGILAERTFTDPAFLQELFLVGTPLLQECSEEDRRKICDHWGSPLYSQVIAGRPELAVE